MNAKRHHNASPRIPRGLVLLSLTGALLLGYASLRQRTESTAPGPGRDSIPLETHSAETRREPSGARAFHPPAATPQTRWADALRDLMAEPDLSRREELGASLLEEAAGPDITTVLAELDRAGFGADDFTRRLLRRWAETEVRAAAAWAEQLPADKARAAALSEVAVEWANADLKSAAEWAQQLPEPSEQQAALLSLANEAVRTAPMAALRLAVELPADANRDETIRRAAMEWAEQDGPGATAWAKQIADVALREKVMAAEAVAWAEVAPEAAATFAVGSLPAGRLLEDTVISITQRWAQQQPDAATAWVEQFPPGKLKLTAFENVAIQSDSNPSAVPASP